MKRLLLFSVCAAFAAAVVSCDGTSGGPFAKVLVSDRDGSVMGYFLGTENDSYRALLQDEYFIPKDDAHPEIWKASDGKGYVSLTDPGTLDIHESPDAKSPVTGTLTYEDGFCPDVYECLGYSKGWFHIAEGYVEEASVQWDAINTF